MTKAADDVMDVCVCIVLPACYITNSNYIIFIRRVFWCEHSLFCSSTCSIQLTKEVGTNTSCIYCSHFVTKVALLIQTSLGYASELHYTECPLLAYLG